MSNLELQVFPTVTDENGYQRIAGSAESATESPTFYSVTLRSYNEEDALYDDILDVSVCSREDAQELCDFIEKAMSSEEVCVEADWQVVDLHG